MNYPILHASAADYFRDLLAQQGGAYLGVRLVAVRPGSPTGDCQLSFCEPGDIEDGDWSLDADGFQFVVAANSLPWLEDAEVLFDNDRLGGQLTIRAPRLKGVEPGSDAPLDARLRWLIEHQINPQLAAHKGHVSLVELTPDRIAVLRFGGGCQGCGMVDITLKQGIEKTLREKLPEISGVIDSTEHAAGTAPYA